MGLKGGVADFGVNFISMMSLEAWLMSVKSHIRAHYCLKSGKNMPNAFPLQQCTFRGLKLTITGFPDIQPTDPDF